MTCPRCEPRPPRITRDRARCVVSILGPLHFGRGATTTAAAAVRATRPSTSKLASAHGNSAQPANAWRPWQAAPARALNAAPRPWRKWRPFACRKRRSSGRRRMWANVSPSCTSTSRPSDPPCSGPGTEMLRADGVAYVTIDATGTRQQGPGGRTAEGRMAYVAGVQPRAGGLGAAPPPQRPLRMQARYVAGLYDPGGNGAAAAVCPRPAGWAWKRPRSGWR